MRKDTKGRSVETRKRESITCFSLTNLWRLSDPSHGLVGATCVGIKHLQPCNIFLKEAKGLQFDRRPKSFVVGQGETLGGRKFSHCGCGITSGADLHTLEIPFGGYNGRDTL